IFTDKSSGKTRTNRKGLQELIGYVRDGDVVRVQSMDRLGRDTLDLYQILNELTDKGTTVMLLSEGMTVSKDETNPTQQMMLGILAAIADFDRVKSANAKLRGSPLPRPRASMPGSPSCPTMTLNKSKSCSNL